MHMKKMYISLAPETANHNNLIWKPLWTRQTFHSLLFI